IESLLNTNESDMQESASDLFFSIYKWMTADATLRAEKFCSISAEFPLSQVDADILIKVFKEDKNLSQNSVCMNLYLCAMEKKYFQDREMYHRTGSLRVPPDHVAQHSSSVLVSSQNSANEGSNVITRKDSGADKNLQGLQAAQAKPSTSAEGNRKRSVENGHVELLKEVPYKRSAATTAIDITESCWNVPTAEACERPKMYFISGSSPGTRRFMEMNLRNFTSKTVVDFPFEEDSASLIHHDNKIFAICSRGESAENQVVRYLSLKKKVWVEMPSLNKPRFGFGWTLAQNSIYVLGGFATTKETEVSVERFWDPFSVVNGHWTTVGVSPHPRADHAVGLIGNQIYLVGGVQQGSTCLRISKSMDTFDIETNKWSRKAEMPSEKTGLCVAVLNSRLYAIGGGDKKEMRKESRTCAVYIPETNEWNAIAPLQQARQDSYAFVLDGKIYVVGGNQGPPTMEIYDVGKDTWTIVGNCKLPTDVHYRNVVIVN
ncbi:unnamed protein product, partial [Allacma fusca]